MTRNRESKVSAPEGVRDGDALHNSQPVSREDVIEATGAIAQLLDAYSGLAAISDEKAAKINAAEKRARALLYNGADVAAREQGEFIGALVRALSGLTKPCLARAFDVRWARIISGEYGWRLPDQAKCDPTLAFACKVLEEATRRPEARATGGQP